jgi:cystathionine gamma-synthase
MLERPREAKKTRGKLTLSVHAGEKRPFGHHALALPLLQTAAYTFEDTADLRQFMDARMWGLADGRVEYGRYGNPTVDHVERKLAELDAGEEAVLFSSGMAAITTSLLAILQSGDHLVVTQDAYRRTRQFCQAFLARLGIDCTVVPPGDIEAIEEALRPETKLIFSESPTNPYLRVMDLRALTELAHRHSVKACIDSTFASPVNQRPLDYGVDLVLHSATKYLGGHNDLLAGVVVGTRRLVPMIRQAMWVMGGVADPHVGFLLNRGLKTLGLRLRQQNATALAVAQFLERHPRVSRVWYPGLESHPDHAVAADQMDGFGGVVSFEIDGDLQATSRLVDALELPIIAPSLGGVETLIEQPALMSYYELTSEERLDVGIKDNLVRLSVGIEDEADIVADLERALSHLP